MQISEIPFPAVTICPINKFSGKKFNYTDVYRAILKLDGNKSRIVTEEEYVFCTFVQLSFFSPNLQAEKIIDYRQNEISTQFY